MALVCLTDRQEWEWVCLLPWAVWLWKGIAWPELGRQPFEGDKDFVQGLLQILGCVGDDCGDHYEPPEGF